MDLNSFMHSDDDIKDLFPDNSQVSITDGQNKEYEYLEDSQILKELLINSNLCHRNLNKILDFGINKTTYGPYEFGIQFNAKFFISIIREYYLKLNCERLNFIVSDGILYFYGHIASEYKIITRVDTHYISQDKVKIIEGHGKELRANFDVLYLLKNLELHNFSNKESLKMYFKINKNIKKNKNESLSINNPFLEMESNFYKFEKEFNFENEAIPGLIIVETIREFNFTIDCNYAPLELCSPPKIPDFIFKKYIFYISIDKLINTTQRMSLQSPIEISCNKYICNFITNSFCENFLMFQNSDGAEFNEENSFNYFKLFDPLIENGTLYKKMIVFTLNKHELDSLKIINKKTPILYFYADKKEKYYFTKETDQDGNITSSVIIKSSENKPKIKDIEDCCLYVDHWEDWINYLSSILTRDCIDDLKQLRKNKGEKNLVSHNKKNKKKKNKNEEKENNNNNNYNINNNERNIGVIDGENELQGMYLYNNNKKGNLNKIVINESNKIVYDKGRGKSINNKVNSNDNSSGISGQNKNVVNPFNFK